MVGRPNGPNPNQQELVLFRDNQIVAVTYDGNPWTQEFYTGSISKGFKYGSYNADEATIQFHQSYHGTEFPWPNSLAGMSKFIDSIRAYAEADYDLAQTLKPKDRELLNIKDKDGPLFKQVEPLRARADPSRHKPRQIIRISKGLASGVFEKWFARDERAW
jgi:hypothetical protein